jgi:uncharacterized membrane protein
MQGRAPISRPPPEVMHMVDPDTAPGPDGRSEAAAIRTAEQLRPRTEHLPLPAWRRATRGESRWPVIAAVGIAVALQVVLPNRFTAGHRAVPTLELFLAVGLWLAHPHKTGHAPPWMRPSSVVLIGMITATNAWSAVRLIQQIIQGRQDNAASLLASGAAIWATNIILFALWYWEFDRGGPLNRARGHAEHPDFSFPQMQNPELAPPQWEPRFPDYLYVSFTNACSFSPTDTMPLSRWAKMAMMAQSAVSLVVIALVVSRAVGLFK